MRKACGHGGGKHGQNARFTQDDVEDNVHAFTVKRIVPDIGMGIPGMGIFLKPWIIPNPAADALLVRHLYSLGRWGRVPTYERSPFGYLWRHNFETPETELMLHCESLDSKHRRCMIGYKYHTVKYPIWGTTRLKGDHLGNVTIPGKEVAVLMGLACDNRDLPGALEWMAYNYSQDTEMYQRCWCKAQCMAPGHQAPTERRRDCPAYWVIRDTLISLCRCGGPCCLAPGPDFDYWGFRRAVKKWCSYKRNATKKPTQEAVWKLYK